MKELLLHRQLVYLVPQLFATIHHISVPAPVIAGFRPFPCIMRSPAFSWRQSRRILEDDSP